jgi:hypothetical protein
MSKSQLSEADFKISTFRENGTLPGWYTLSSGVARFFLLKHTYTAKSIPKYTKQP